MLVPEEVPVEMDSEVGRREEVGRQEQSWEEREAEISVGGKVGREVTI